VADLLKYPLYVVLAARDRSWLHPTEIAVVLGNGDGFVSIEVVHEEVYDVGEPQSTKLHRERCRQPLRN
jgi:hypothetical protein